MTELKIRDANIPAHLDIEKELKNIKDGQFTFTLRINAGNIADLAVVEYIDVRDYLRLKSVTTVKLNSPYSN